MSVAIKKFIMYKLQTRSRNNLEIRRILSLIRITQTQFFRPYRILKSKQSLLHRYRRVPYVARSKGTSIGETISQKSPIPVPQEAYKCTRAGCVPFENRYSPECFSAFEAPKNKRYQAHMILNTHRPVRNSFHVGGKSRPFPGSFSSSGGKTAACEAGLDPTDGGENILTINGAVSPFRGFAI